MTTAPLTPAAAADLLGAGGAIVRAELSALPESAATWHPAPGEWCALEVLGHLIETERRGFAGRIRIILSGDSPRLEGWDQEAVARQRNDCARDGLALCDEFIALRTESRALVASLKPADLPRGGHHPTVGFLTVGDLLHEWVHHDRNHIRQLLANAQAFVWPNMGNAQRFSQPT